MKQRSKWLKPRVWIPLLALLLFYIGCGVYVLVAGRVNTVSVIISEKEYVAGSQTAVSSDERVMRIRQITEEPMDDGSLTSRSRPSNRNTCFMPRRLDCCITKPFVILTVMNRC